MSAFVRMQKLASIAVLVFGLSICASGQTYEISVLSGWARMSKRPLGSISADDPKGSDTRFKDGYSFGARLTFNTRGYYGHELGYVYTRAGIQSDIPDANGNRTRYESKVAIQRASYNFLIYFMPRGERWRPFITGGLHAQKYGRPGIPDWPAIHTRNFGANYGAGIKLKLLDHAFLRLDVRDYITGRPYDLYFEGAARARGRTRQQEASLGIVIGF
jgi:hypothetical protein